MKCAVVPVVIGATGSVTNEVEICLEIIPGKHSIDPLQNSSCSGNVTHKTESATVCQLRPVCRCISSVRL